MADIKGFTERLIDLMRGAEGLPEESITIITDIAYECHDMIRILSDETNQCMKEIVKLQTENIQLHQFTEAIKNLPQYQC